MPNRVIRESICRSKSLAKCSIKAQDQFHKFLLFADDWGCFKIDYKKMKDDLFPYRKDIPVSKIESLLDEYKKQGMLFFWANRDKVYGFFVNWDNHTGEYLSRRGKRKTPEPPEKELAEYNDYFKSLQVTSNGFKLLHNGSSDSGKERKGIESESERKGKEKNKTLTFVELFNSTCITLSKVKDITDTRKTLITKRLKEHPEPEWWKLVFEKINKVRVENDDKQRTWKPNFDWIVKDDTKAVRVAEGHYDKFIKKESWRDKYRDKGTARRDS